MKVLHVVGARPNFMKIAPIIKAFNNYNAQLNAGDEEVSQVLVHTGQHYGKEMSKLFFDDLKIPVPDVNLGVGSSSHAGQTAEIIKRFEPVLLKEKPDVVILVGDVNSTLACSVVASKIQYPKSPTDLRLNRISPVNTPSKIRKPHLRRPLIAHVEAGLRSFDRSMPEEINRIVTDAICDLLFTTEESANENLLREGIPAEKIHFVGNVMIDTLLGHVETAKQSNILCKLRLTNFRSPLPDRSKKPYAIVTLHRPSNVDDENVFSGIIEALTVIAKRIPVLFPIHPRTLARVREFKFDKYFNWDFYTSAISSPPNSANKHQNLICLVPPLGYLDFLHLMANSKLVMTDSGGIQEETTILKIPCLTIRRNTERPVTINYGTNVLAGTTTKTVTEAAFSQMDRYGTLFEAKSSKTTLPMTPPPLWDGGSAQRIAEILITTPYQNLQTKEQSQHPFLSQQGT